MRKFLLRRSIITCASLALLNLRVEKRESLKRTCLHLFQSDPWCQEDIVHFPFFGWIMYQTFSGHCANVEVGNVGYRKIQSRTAYSPATQNEQLANFCPWSLWLLGLIQAHLVDKPLSSSIHPLPILWHKYVILTLNNLWNGRCKLKFIAIFDKSKYEGLICGNSLLLQDRWYPSSSVFIPIYSPWRLHQKQP